MRNKGKIIMVIVIVTLLILLLIFVGRNVFIIKKLSNNAEKTIKATNYHAITYIYSLGNYSKEEIFKLGDKKKIVLTQLVNDSISTTTMFANKVSNDETTYLVNIYGESKEGKKAKLNERLGLVDTLKNEFYTGNWWDWLKASALTTIKTTKYNGNECYYISNFNGANSVTREGMYIDKDTGLPISVMGYEYEISNTIQGETTTRFPIFEYVYEFDTVTEDDFIEPNIGEYEVQE